MLGTYGKVGKQCYLSYRIILTRYSSNFFFCETFRNKYEKSTDSTSPPGYSQSAGQNGSELSKDSESSRLMIKKSWDLALGPLKQVSTWSIFSFFC